MKTFPALPRHANCLRARDDSNVRPLPSELHAYSKRAKQGPLPLADVSSIEDLRAPVAQLDRALPSEGKGRTFESSRARHFANCGALLRLDAGHLNHFGPFRDLGLDPAGEFFRRGVDYIKAQRRELLSSFRLNHRLADLAMEQLDNGLGGVGGNKNARYRVGLLTGQ